MFNNVSNKLKVVAKIYFWVMVAVSVICALVFGINYTHSIFRTHNTINACLPIFLIGGPACAYVTSLLIYGFGQLIENTGNGEEKEAEIKNPFKKAPKKEKPEETATVVDAEITKPETQEKTEQQ